MAEDDKKRTDIEDLPREEEVLSSDEAKSVQGGAVSNTYRGTTTVNQGSLVIGSTSTTVGGSLSIDPSDPSKKMGDGSV